MPHFCKNSTILIIVIFALLVALIAALLQNEQLSLTYFNLAGLYMVWLFLFWGLSVCTVGKLKLKDHWRYAYCVTSCLAIFFAYDSFAQYITTDFIDGWRLLRYGIVALIFLLISLRVIQLANIYSERSRADLQTRLSALQSKIQPHFLFNSLNTIAELTHTDPKQAESAIDSLAIILRSNLKDDDAFHSIEDEITLCEKYIELEKWRFDQRLRITFEISPAAKTAIIPKLLFQPLIENAVRHGIAPFQYGGSIEIIINNQKKQLICSITNTVQSKEPVPEEHHRELQGHGIAVNNLRERLFVIYDDRYNIKAKQSDHRYYVELSLPMIPPKKIALNL